MFLNPFMLLGAAAIGIPIVIHLLNKRKFQRVVWAAMRFLQVSVEKNQRRLRIEDLLLLVVRCLLILALVMALARPAIRSASAAIFGQAKVTGVIVLDNSYSMGQTDGVASRFDRAKEAAEQVVASLPSGSSVAVLLASDTVTALIPEPSYDLNLARKTIRAARLSDRGTDLLPAFREATAILQRRSGMRKEAYFITDGQRIGWRSHTEIERLLSTAKDDIHANVLLVGRPEAQNLAISDLQLAGGLAPVGHPLSFQVQVMNCGKSEARNVRVTLRVDGEEPSDEASIDAIRPGETQAVSLSAKLRTAAHHTVTASLAGDHLPADDRRTIAVRGLEQVSILLVDGDSGRELRDSEVFYLKHALLPVPPAEYDRYFVKVETIGPAELESTRLDKYDTVFLCNITDFSRSTLEALESYLRRGRGIVIFPGANTVAGFYNDQLLRNRKMLPAALGELRGQAEQAEKFLTLSDRHLDHPIASLWKDPAAGAPSSAHFYRVFDLIPNPKNDSARVIFSYADGKPAVMEQPWGQGSIVLFSSTADTAWNDLPVRPGLFVPLIYRIVGSIISRQDEALNVKVGQRFRHAVPGELLGRDAVIAAPDTARDNPAESRRIEMQEGVPTLQYDRTDLGGAYEVKVQAPPATIRFAAQLDTAESDPEELAPMELDAIGAVARVVRWQGGVTLSQNLEQQRVGTELWLPIAMAALVIALVETVLAQWFSHPK